MSKVVLITGATSGMGELTVEVFKDVGYISVNGGNGVFFHFRAFFLNSKPCFMDFKILKITIHH